MKHDQRVAVIGLGNIGGGIARNLLRAGRDVTVVDLDSEKVLDLVTRGARAGSSPGDAAREVDVVITSLPGPRQIAAVGADLIAHLRPGSAWLEMSTNDLATARRLAADCAAIDVDLLDAPVSGGPEGAEAATLSIFVGGDDEVVERLRPLLDEIGSKIDHLGAHGAGTVAKIAQVVLCYTQTVTLIEALILGAKGGVEPVRMLDLIQHSAGSSYSATAYGPEIVAGTYDASFPLSHAAKDLRLAMEMADALGVDLPFTRDVAALYARAEETFGPTAAHCLAVQLIERTNDIVLHEIGNDQ